MLFLILILVCALAYANGANDVSRGIATLVGSGVARYRVAVVWGSIWTGVGALLAAWVARGLLVRFSGKGLMDGFAVGPEFFAAAAGLVVLSRPLFRRVAQTAGGYCVCVQREAPALVAMDNGPALALQRTDAFADRLVAGSTDHCGQETVISHFNLLDAAHWLSAGGISLARGMNDAPKILALAWGAGAIAGIGETAGFGLIALAMTAGCLIGGFRVTDTLANRITRLCPAEGFSANFVTACLVIAASRLGLPLSTTHVNGGALFGVGLGQRKGAMDLGVVRNILLSWAVTLPAGMGFAAGIFLVLRAVL